MRRDLGSRPREFKSRVAKNHLNWNAVKRKQTAKATRERLSNVGGQGPLYIEP